MAIVAAVVVVLLGAGITGMALAHSDDRPGWGRHPMSTSGWVDGSMMGSARSTDEAGYLSEMVAHHREAIVAAGELIRSDRPAMRAFGRRIVADQTAQIELMQGWLAEWYAGERDAAYAPMMRDLSGLSGVALDRAFLDNMIGHHMAAVMMSQQLLMGGLAEHREVVELARTIRDDQRVEIRWMHAARSPLDR
ncbi:DUF305 domain-containing protein [Nocardioides zhouii]|nr:DUF305 domain-containing protein [Nocardioides zhouii]